LQGLTQLQCCAPSERTITSLQPSGYDTTLIGTTCASDYNPDTGTSSGIFVTKGLTAAKLYTSAVKGLAGCLDDLNTWQKQVSQIYTNLFLCIEAAWYGKTCKADADCKSKTCLPAKKGETTRTCLVPSAEVMPDYFAECFYDTLTGSAATNETRANFM
jgi:hypothetical protein